jgi:hypothetical protein
MPPRSAVLLHSRHRATSGTPLCGVRDPQRDAARGALGNLVVVLERRSGGVAINNNCPGALRLLVNLGIRFPLELPAAPDNPGASAAARRPWWPKRGKAFDVVQLQTLQLRVQSRQVTRVMIVYLVGAEVGGERCRYQWRRVSCNGPASGGVRARNSRQSFPWLRE